jgi:hypothetical protein
MTLPLSLLLLLQLREEVDLETRHLREIRSRGKLEPVHVVEDIAAVEAADEDETGVREKRDVVPPRARPLPVHRSRLILQRYCSCVSGARAHNTKDEPRLNSMSSFVYPLPSCPPQIKR